ncbi:MAG: cytochrome P450, partial [Candidatus Binatia bacterium]
MDYSPFSPDVQENPYPYYAHLRRHAPVYYVEEVGFWVVSRYADVLDMVKHPQVFSSSTAMDALFGDLDPWTREAPPLNGSDPPYHTRLRKLVNRAFTPRRVASLELHLREMVQRLIAPLAARGAGDLIRDLAIPLPIMAIAELLGIPPDKYPDFKRWTEDLVKGVNWPTLPPEERVQVRRSITEVRAHFQAVIETYRKHPGDNLLSDMIRAEEENQTLSSEEVLSLAVLVLFGGAETTTNLIGNAVLALLDHPDELAKVRANP